MITLTPEEILTATTALKIAERELDRLVEGDVLDGLTRKHFVEQSEKSRALRERLEADYRRDDTVQENPCVTYGKRARTCYRCDANFIGTVAETLCGACRPASKNFGFASLLAATVQVDLLTGDVIKHYDARSAYPEALVKDESLIAQYEISACVGHKIKTCTSCKRDFVDLPFSTTLCPRCDVASVIRANSRNSVEIMNRLMESYRHAGYRGNF